MGVLLLGRYHDYFSLYNSEFLLFQVEIEGLT